MKKHHFEPVWAIGLMSGTSLDGVDAALIRSDGIEVREFGPWLTQPFDAALRARLRAATHGEGDLLEVERDVTLFHAEAVKQLLKKAEMRSADVKIIGFHGQTVAHRPDEHLTRQIGDGSLLCERTHIDVVCDFRRRDMAAGGVGAPLVPLYHAALAKKFELPVCVLNIGGIANMTWIGRSEDTGDDILALDIMSFDTGPGNVLLNEWAWRTKQMDYDKDGMLALSGVADQTAVAELLKNPFFAQMPPKSLDRNHFSLDLIASLSPEDGAATLAEFTAAAIHESSRFFPMQPHVCYVCGGGRHNPAIMQALACKFDDVSAVESLGWIGDAIEAQAFAYLALRSLRGLPLSLPTTTGANRAVTGGAFYRA